jgi:hypothetical protein
VCVQEFVFQLAILAVYFEGLGAFRHPRPPKRVKFALVAKTIHQIQPLSASQEFKQQYKTKYCKHYVVYNQGARSPIAGITPIQVSTCSTPFPSTSPRRITILHPFDRHSNGLNLPASKLPLTTLLQYHPRQAPRAQSGRPTTTTTIQYSINTRNSTIRPREIATRFTSTTTSAESTWRSWRCAESVERNYRRAERGDQRSCEYTS